VPVRIFVSFEATVPTDGEPRGRELAERYGLQPGNGFLVRSGFHRSHATERQAPRHRGPSGFHIDVRLRPRYEGFNHYHDAQDELYFVHAGTARVEIGSEARTIGPGGLLHVESTTPRKVSNASDTEDLILLVVGAKDGYVKRDGHMVDSADIERRATFGQ
jgi:mannose-6-phosphate isomerase-like protein (cupin superfamily)